jgi:colanic acid/amylovoran biosynthesis glycosyltransferase
MSKTMLPRITYLFTTFPKYSETFLARKIEALAETGKLDLSLYSLMGGKGSQFAGFPLCHMRWWHCFSALAHAFILCFRRPALCLKWLRLYRKSPPRSFTNAGEQLLGIAFALSHAKRIQLEAPDRLHAVWGTGPATAALLLRDLTGIPFSMAAHAYDIFRAGGDCLLKEKIATANFIHTSSEAAANELRTLSGNAKPIHVIRRGLDHIPPFQSNKPFHTPLHILSVGRLVAKKGWFDQLALYRAALDAGIDFTVRIVGSGPLQKALQQRIHSLGLVKHVQLLGQLHYAAVTPLYEWADVFIFTGKVADDGDRDGFPNVLGEAMAHGVIVMSTAVAATAEAIINGQTGELFADAEPGKWIARIQHLQANPDHCETLQRGAYDWVVENFDARKNAKKLLALHKTFLTA